MPDVHTGITHETHDDAAVLDRLDSLSFAPGSGEIIKDKLLHPEAHDVADTSIAAGLERADDPRPAPGPDPALFELTERDRDVLERQDDAANRLAAYEQRDADAEGLTFLQAGLFDPTATDEALGEAWGSLSAEARIAAVEHGLIQVEAAQLLDGIAENVDRINRLQHEAATRTKLGRANVARADEGMRPMMRGYSAEQNAARFEVADEILTGQGINFDLLKLTDPDTALAHLRAALAIVDESVHVDRVHAFHQSIVSAPGDVRSGLEVLSGGRWVSPTADLEAPKVDQARMAARVKQLSPKSRSTADEIRESVLRAEADDSKFRTAIDEAYAPYAEQKDAERRAEDRRRSAFAW